MAARAVAVAAAIVNGTDVNSWAGLTQATGDNGAEVFVAGAKSIMAMLLTGGVLGIAGAVTWQGSIDRVNWFTMTSEIGIPVASISVALNTPVMLKERPLWIRPLVTAGDGTTALGAMLIVNR